MFGHYVARSQIYCIIHLHVSCYLRHIIACLSPEVMILTDEAMIHTAAGNVFKIFIRETQIQ